jgi:hypothetical protein
VCVLKHGAENKETYLGLTGRKKQRDGEEYKIMNCIIALFSCYC